MFCKEEVNTIQEPKSITLKMEFSSPLFVLLLYLIIFIQFPTKLLITFPVTQEENSKSVLFSPTPFLSKPKTTKPCPCGRYICFRITILPLKGCKVAPFFSLYLHFLSILYTVTTPFFLAIREMKITVLNFGGLHPSKEVGL